MKYRQGEGPTAHQWLALGGRQERLPASRWKREEGKREKESTAQGK